MKKSLFFAAMACIAFAGCTEDEVFNTDLNQERAIAFSAPVVAPNTRAAMEHGTVYDTGSKFKVWGYYYSTAGFDNFSGGKLYINEAEASHSGGTWYPKTAGNSYYWPKDGTLTFIAYSPSNAEDNCSGIQYTATGITIDDYTVPITPSLMQDLMFSERVYDRTSSNQDYLAGTYTGVDLQFRHALSSIVFKVVKGGKTPGTDVKITGIKLKNVKTTGDFNQNLEDEPNNKTNLIVTATNPLAANMSATPAAWTLGAATADYTVDLTEKQLKNGDDYATAYWPCTGDFVAPTVDANFRKTDLLLLPQPQSGITLQIDYTVKSPDSIELPQQHNVDLSGTWEIGHRYVYTITISFDPITMAPVVDVDWEDATPGIEL